MDLDLKKRKVHLLFFIVGIVALGITAEKCRQLVGEEAASKSGNFTFLNCFDLGTGTLACSVKEGVKLYFYNIRAAVVEKARSVEIKKSLADSLSQGMNTADAAKQAERDGKKAAELASRQAKRITGPIISSGWDFFEAVYFGGTMAEGFLRGTGTLFGTYAGGFIGEERLERFGYLVGSHMGSWVGGRIGLMVYDVVNGVHHLLQFAQSVENEVLGSPSDTSKVSEDLYSYETQEHVDSESSERSSDLNETPSYESNEEFGGSKSSDQNSDLTTPAYESSESYEL